jgi:hypothetical protein
MRLEIPFCIVYGVIIFASKRLFQAVQRWEVFSILCKRQVLGNPPAKLGLYADGYAFRDFTRVGLR